MSRSSPLNQVMVVPKWGRMTFSFAKISFATFHSGSKELSGFLVGETAGLVLEAER